MTQENKMTDFAMSGGVWRGVVPENMSGERLDVFLSAAVKDAGISRSKVQSLIKSGKAAVGGEVVRKPKHKLDVGVEVTLEVDLPSGEMAPEDEPLEVIYEDDRLIVVNKPDGLTVHPAPAQPAGTLVNRLVHHYPQMKAMEGDRPGIVHRIDKDTSGILMVALDEATRLKLSEDFAERTIEKHYLAVVHGVPCDAGGKLSGEIDAPIGRDPKHKTKMAVTEKGGREARSAWEVLWTSPDGRASLVRVQIFTGRTHQIRVHMAHIGHPLMGDVVYGARQHKEWMRETGASEDLAPRQMLHAWRLGFTHPHSGEAKEFILPPPQDFQRLLFSLARQTLRVGIVGMPGCGKSALSGFLKERGVPVFSADAMVASLYEAGEDGWALIRRRFGEEYAPDGQPVAKGLLFAGMRESEVFRREVLDMVHPLVEHRLSEFWAEHAEAEIAAAEVPLLVEGGWDERGIVDVVCGVKTPEDARRGRLKARGWDDDTIAFLESWQWSEQDKLARCGEVVDNSGTLENLEAEAEKLFKRLRSTWREEDGKKRAYLQKLWGGG